MIGTVLKHRYEVREKVGDGNIFSVYRCEDKIENRIVAAKILLPQYSSNRLFAERMLIEAQAMVGVDHPGIVEVYDTGETEGTYFIITEYIRGVDLKERIRRNAPFPLVTTIDLGIAICDVLDFAHKKGFVHGDLRPSNILVTPEGHIKVSDFWVGEAISSSQSIRTTQLMRSIHYMSPEVAESSPSTPSSDIYSLGVMLYECLTGTMLYDAETPIAIALKHAKDPIPSVRSLNPSVPKELESIIAKALQKAPMDRYRSAKAMMNDLKSLGDSLKSGKYTVESQPTQQQLSEPETVRAEPVKPDTVVYGEEPEDVEDTRDVSASIVSAIKKTLLAIIIVITLGIIIMIANIMSRPIDVHVPSLVGKSVEEAERIARNYKLNTQVRTEQYNEDFPLNTVYFTNPSADRLVKSGRTVDLWVSKGSKYATVPDTVKLTLEEARTRLDEAKLNVGEVSQDYNNDIPAGSIISQSPGPGTKVEHNIPVKLVFSLGPKPQETQVVNSDNYSNDPSNTGPVPEQSKNQRSFNVKFTVPNGPDDQRIQIVVKDDYGENIVYSDSGKAGEVVEQTVKGFGDKVTILIYINDKLVREEKKWKQ